MALGYRRRTAGAGERAGQEDIWRRMQMAIHSYLAGVGVAVAGAGVRGSRRPTAGADEEAGHEDIATSAGKCREAGKSSSFSSVYRTMEEPPPPAGMMLERLKRRATLWRLHKLSFLPAGHSRPHTVASPVSGFRISSSTIEAASSHALSTRESR